MGTFVSISVDKQHKELISPAFKLLKKIESSISSFDKNSPIYKLNENRSAKLDNYSYEALQLSLKYYKETDGYFDVAVGSITKDLYHFGEDERIASKKSMQKASTSMDGLLFDKQKAVITDTIKIDLGGMGKGYGIDKVSQFFRNNSVENAVIALSGDIRCIGECKIAVNNPLKNDAALAVFTMCDTAVSTSGNYNRYVGNITHNHLINPKKKNSEQNFISVTLISKLPSATLDAFATAVSVMSLKKAYLFLASQPIAYIILQADKKLVVSKNLQSYVSELKLK
ncbi:FAD:protein FMN transferase [Sulfurimonas paralvinellae]|uniref:FAD:protein FMN transferase n=2 Tax=Sulfurimonas paralvinellae TaxID=317658 RepID=A0A7M1BAN5_9BACT|nr:FAD:protein FMN transferase [Sulfurimonas paralvinellae]